MGIEPMSMTIHTPPLQIFQAKYASKFNLSKTTNITNKIICNMKLRI